MNCVEKFSSQQMNCETSRKSVQCHTCYQHLQSYANLYNHRIIDHMQLGGNAVLFQPLPWETIPVNALVK